LNLLNRKLLDLLQFKPVEGVRTFGPIHRNSESRRTKRPGRILAEFGKTSNKPGWRRDEYLAGSNLMGLELRMLEVVVGRGIL
jgi:hypothetical protein